MRAIIAREKKNYGNVERNKPEKENEWNNFAISVQYFVDF